MRSSSSGCIPGPPEINTCSNCGSVLRGSAPNMLLLVGKTR
ncbi:Uncharacterised protein [Vibrio cholerae]|nr:Uncharacterised protein [Vibrio cholerae]CSI00813.1 Uncharacterised protein [Vibrio cholerae]